MTNPEPSGVIQEWVAPSRLFKKRGKEYFSTILAIVVLLSVILFILHEWLLILLVFTFAFFSYVLATVKPEEIKYQIAKKGIKIGSRYYVWSQLTEFWIEQKHEYHVFHITMPLQSPGRVILLIKDIELKNKVLKFLDEKLIYHEEPQKTWAERAGDWLERKIQLEKSS